MSDDHSVLYVSSIDEAADLYDLPLDHPENGEDWALVAASDGEVRLEFVNSEEIITVSRERFDELRDKYSGSELFTPTDPTETVLRIGSGAIIDRNRGHHPLTGVESDLPQLTATVFVMEAEQGWRDWPERPSA